MTRIERSGLPVFRYHPDPVSTGAIRADPDALCPCCERRTGWAYTTTPYGLGEQPELLCPWCIADGSAHTRFGSEFVSDIGETDIGETDINKRDTGGEVPREIIDEVNLRTPGYLSWQGEQWLTHCGDAAAFLGPAGWEELRKLPQACAALVADGWDESVLPMMTRDGDLTAYLFKCLHCHTYLANADAA